MPDIYYLCDNTATVLKISFLMEIVTTILLISVISFAATLFRSTFGFGEALIAVPLFCLFLPVQVAVPLAVMMSIVVAAVVVVQDYKQIHLSSAKWLIGFAILGIPFGLALLFYADEFIVKIFLGIIIIAYSIYSIAGKNNYVLENDSKLWLFICGFLSGVFGGAYGVNGPPLVVYGNLRRWNAQDFRATLQAYFLIAGLVSIIGYIGKGLLDTTVMEYCLYSLPAIIPAIFLGRYFNRKIKSDSFYRYVYWGLAFIGIMLIMSTILIH